MATDEDLPFKVEQWDRDGRIERMIARAAHLICVALTRLRAPGISKGAAHPPPGDPGDR